MRGLDMKLVLAGALALALAGPALAQAPAAATPAPAPEALPGAADAARPPLDVELETGGYAYNSGGRRDPFVSLQRPVAADRGPKTRKPGMEGFLIQEIALKGIVKTKGGGMGEASQSGLHRHVPGRRRQVVFRDHGAAALRRCHHRRGRDLRNLPARGD